jgi:primosomal protein N' (replication factor Y)
MVAPLRLKSERVGKPTINANRPVLSVLVDTGIYHLDGEYNYLLPSTFEVEPGQWVSVPFKSRMLRGLVTRRSAQNRDLKLSFINKVLPGPFISKEFLNFYTKVAERWAVPIFDVLRFVDKKTINETSHRMEIGSPPRRDYRSKIKRNYLQLSPLEDEITQVRIIAEKVSRTGRTLLVVPELRILELLKSDLYETGMRSAILQSESYENILILREESEHHYEIRSPGFNTRDVALIRSSQLLENLLFIGFSPSLEMTKLIERGYVVLKAHKSRNQIAAKSSIQGELIPSLLLSKIKISLDKGPVLVLVPSKGYGLAISCSRCRNVAKCDCGGRLVKKAQASVFSCALCVKEFHDLKCKFCDSADFKVLGKGIERIAEEFGRTFSNRRIFISTVDKPFEGSVPRDSFLLSTLGMVPQQKFSQVVFLEGIGNSSDARSTERYLSQVFRYLSYSDGNGLLVESPESPIVNAAIRWNPFSLLKREVEDLTTVGLPPSARSLILIPSTDSKDELARISTGFRSAINSGRLPKSFRFFNANNLRISAFFSLKDSENVLAFIREFQRKRSIAGKKVLKLRVDPYRFG